MTIVNETQWELTYEGASGELKRIWKRFFLRAKACKSVELMEGLLDLRLKYVLPTMYDRRTRQSHDILKQLHKYFNRQLCEPIHYNVRLSEAPGHGQTIFEYKRQAVGAHDYSKLIRRIMNDGGP